MDTQPSQSQAAASGDLLRAIEGALTLRRFAALLAATLAVTFPDVLLGAGTFIFRDFGLFSFPLAHFQRECFWDGELPIWNPLNNCGIPFLAQWSGLALYPPALFYLLFPLTWALGVFCLLHVFWGGLGMFALVRHLTNSPLAAAIAGVAFAFSGFVQSCLMWHMTAACVSWFPWVVLTAMRAWQEGDTRDIALAALAGAMQMLTGPPEMILATWIPVAALWVADLAEEGCERRRLTLRFVTLVALISLLASPQILPFLDLLGLSQRNAAYDTGGWAMPATGWANFLLPRFQAYPSPAGVWLQRDQGVLSSYFPGIAITALAILCCWRLRTRRVALLALLSVVCLVLALGNATPIHGFAKSLFPPLGLMRYPIKFVFPVCLMLPLLAGLGVDELLKRPASQRAWRWIGMGSLAAILSLTAIAGLAPVNKVAWSSVALDGFLRALVLVGFMVAVRVALKTDRRRTATFTLAAMIGVVWLDLASHALPQNPRVDRAVLEPGIESIEALTPRPHPGGPRAMVSLEAHRQLENAMLSDPAQGHLLHRAALWANANMIEKAPVIDGHFPLFLGQEEAVRVALYQASELPAGLADFLGIAHVTQRGAIFDWTARPSALPLVTTGQEPRFAPSKAIPALLAGKDFNPRQVALFDEPDAAKLTPLFAAAASPEAETPPIIESSDIGRHRIEIKARSDAPALVLIAIAHHANWRASVNGEPASVLRANGAFMAVPLRHGGSHEIILTYDDRQFKAGGALSLATLALLLATWIYTGRSAPRQPMSRTNP